MRTWRWGSGAVLTFFVGACGENPVPTPPTNEPPPVPCEQAVMAGVPIVALEWSSPRETYLAPDHGASSLGIDYFVSPPAHVDHIALRFDFDPLTVVDPVAFEGECRLTFPIDPVLAAVPTGTEDVVSAVVLASSTETHISRTGRFFVTTGSRSIELRTDGLDAGDPSEGAWWALFEPAAGNARLVIVPATVDRMSFRIPGIPTDQPGIVALIQTRALEYDAATRTIYAPWGFAGEWRRYARSWYGALLWRQPDDLVPLSTVVPPDADILLVHGRGAPVFSDGATRVLRIVSSGEADNTFEIACDVGAVELDVLSFVELALGADARPVRPGETTIIEGACEAEATSWSFDVHSRSMNGRSGALLLRRGAEVSP